MSLTKLFSVVTFPSIFCTRRDSLDKMVFDSFSSSKYLFFPYYSSLFIVVQTCHQCRILTLNHSIVVLQFLNLALQLGNAFPSVFNYGSSSHDRFNSIFLFRSYLLRFHAGKIATLSHTVHSLTTFLSFGTCRWISTTISHTPPSISAQGRFSTLPPLFFCSIRPRLPLLNKISALSLSGMRSLSCRVYLMGFS